MSELETFGDRLKALRETRGFTRRGLDEEAGCGIGYAALIESGKRGKKVGFDVAKRYAVALGCSAEWLLDGTGKPPRLKGRAA